MNTNKKTILITWWLGYIWSHAVVAIEQAGYKTVIVDNLSNTCIDVMDWIEKILWYKVDFFDVDLRKNTPLLTPPPTGEGEEESLLLENRKVNYIDWVLDDSVYSLEDVFGMYKFDWVIHFAWLKAVGESCEKPLLYFDNNVNWSVELFGMMEKYWVKNIIFSSSATVYDEDNSLPLKETWKLWTTNPYWTTKLLIEKILEDLSKFAWFNVINLRYFNPIWAHSSWYIWEDPDGIPNNLLPFIMKVASWELEKLRVFWDDYDTVDWTWVRDYIDVVDLIDGHLLAYERLDTPPLTPPLTGEGNNKKWFFDVYNLGVGRWVSVLEMVEGAREVTWKEIPYDIVERRDWDIGEVYCDPEKAERELGFKTKVSLKESLENSWRFYDRG